MNQSREHVQSGRPLSLDLFRLALDVSADLIYIVDAVSARIVEVNRTVCQELGYSRDELLSMHGYEITTANPADAKRRLARLVATQPRSGMRKGVLRRKDGTIFPVEINRRAVVIAEQSYMIAIARDLTERLRAEEALRKSEERFALFMEHMPGPAFIKDAQGRYVYVNPACGVSQRVGAKGWMGKTDEDLFPAEAARELRANDRKVLQSGEPLQSVEIVHWPDEIRYYLTSKFLIPESSGLAPLLGGAALDVTHLKQTEEALRRRYKVTDRIEARVLARTTKHKPADGSTHWSSRKLAAELGDISHMTVSRIWAKHGIKPHRLEGYLASNDPDFETKAAEVIGLYLNPPQHAAVFSVDEKTAIQALDRKDPVLPLSPGRAERHGFEYFRHGTLSLYAAFNTKTGEVLGKTATRHTSAEFVAFLTDIVANQPKRKEIHVIADNLSAHKTKHVDAFLAEHTNVQLHFTPTYSSWLNQVELWFAKIERDVIARGVFTSVSDLKRKLMRYIRHYNKQPKAVKWKYFDPSRRITPDSIVTAH